MTQETPKPSAAERMRQLLKSANEEIAGPPAPRAGTKSDQPPALPAPAAPGGNKLPIRERILRAMWTLTSVISLTINVVLIIVLAVLWQNFTTLQEMTGTVGQNLLGGLYDNFVKMDEAHIITTIAVDSEIPINFNLPVETETIVTLTDQVQLTNAYVVIDTPLLNISAPAIVTLPKGTRLPIALSINVPVDTTVPVHLDVPVDIPLAQTELHEPFTGLQKVLKPYYCLLFPNATLWDNRPACIP